MADVSVFGLGYVGAVTAACLADRGFDVIGVDVNPDKVDQIARGVAPIIEEGIGELTARQVESGRLTATTDVASAVERTRLSLVCVGTPSAMTGALDLTYVERVAEQIGEQVASLGRRHTVVVRSTVLPGTTNDVVRSALERASGKRVGADIGLAFNPEFLREGSSIRDFREPPFTLIGADDDRTASEVAALYDWLEADLIVSDPETAEMVKYVNNSYHAVKVAFANEVGRLSKSLGVDSHAVMDIFCRDERQNLGPSYLRPGYAFGGSCLPKDLRALTHHARVAGVPVQLLDAALTSNRSQVEEGIALVEGTGRKRVGLLGLSFKAGTDDLRESPLVELVERLTGRGHDVRIFDEHVSLARLVGANRSFIERELPHLDELLVPSMDALLAHADVLVIGNAEPAFADVGLAWSADRPVVDLVRCVDPAGAGPNLHGLSW